MIINKTWGRFMMFLVISLNSYGHPLDFSSIDNQLQQDYQLLFRFSNQMRSYVVGEARFNALFQQGIETSLLFYEAACSSQHRFQRHAFEKTVFNASSLNHPINKQRVQQREVRPPFKVLNGFSGKWFGKWKTMEVSHLWLPTRKCNFKVVLGYELIGFQSCFTGDGFGWNYLVRKGKNIVILGYVYHFDQKGELAYGNPHYGFPNNLGGLTWISNDHIYYEFLCKKKTCQLSTHYVITAVPYRTIQKPTFKELTQAVYTNKTL